MEYKKGDKFIIEIDSEYLNPEIGATPKYLYKIKGFNSLVFDKNGLDKLQKYEVTKSSFNSSFDLLDVGCEIIYEDNVRAVILDMPDEDHITVLNELGIVEEISRIDIDVITGESYEEDFINLLNKLQRE